MGYQFPRRRTWLPIIIVLIAVCFAVAAYKNREGQDSRPVILVTGDFKKIGDFANDVLEGANIAADALKPNVSGPKPIIQILDTEGRNSESIFRNAFLENYTTRNVCAVISADISTIAPVVVKTANSYGVPVLLTVATNDDVLAQKRGDLTFRLGPTDTRQSEVLAGWLRTKARPAIIHGGQTPYGRFLGAETIDRLAQMRDPSQPPPIITDYLSGSDFFSILAPMKTLQVDGIAFVGYADRFKELYGKLKALNFQPSVLLSDGCYTPTLIQQPPEGDFYLSFPVHPKRRPDGVQANGVFGFDAYTLLAYTFADIERRPRTDLSFPTALRSTAKEEPVKKELIGKYDFGANGENRLAHFEIFPLAPEATSH